MYGKCGLSLVNKWLLIYLLTASPSTRTFDHNVAVDPFTVGAASRYHRLAVRVAIESSIVAGELVNRTKMRSDYNDEIATFKCSCLTFAIA